MNIFVTGLRLANYQVIEATNGVEGMARFHEHLPDLVITDIIMREMEGIEVLLTILKLAAQVPVIVISGNGKYLDYSRKLGARQTLLKPFRLPELITCIEIALAG